MKFKLNIGTFNVRSIGSDIRKEQLAIDLERYHLDVLCLQETKIENGVDQNVGDNRLLCFPSDSRHYGCGFLISERCKHLIKRTWKVSDRICVVQLENKLLTRHRSRSRSNQNHDKNNSISIINVYAPTSERTQKYPEELDQFHKDLRSTVNQLGNKTVLIIAGDFNAKIGRRQDNEKCLGVHSKGKRNNNGEKLIEFCEETNLFITNSAFDHPSRHKTTWIGQRRDKESGKIINIYNQIDYIICRHRHKQFVTNARSYGGTLLTSDHKLVKTNFTIELCKQRQSNTVKKSLAINKANIVDNRECRAQYQHLLNTHLWQTQHENDTPCDQWKQTQQAIKRAAEDSAGTLIIHKKNYRRTPDKTISNLSIEQKETRIQIQNTKDDEERLRLKRKRNKILHNIRKQTIKLRNEELDKKVKEIEKAENSQLMFQAIRSLNQKPFENPKVEDKNGKLLTNPNNVLEIVAEHFKSKFYDPREVTTQPFEGEPRPLNKPFTVTEIRESIKRLNNNRAPGEDDIPAELLKYGTSALEDALTNILNDTFAKHEDPEINSGVLITLAKPGKPKGPAQNLRPITLLNTLRKTLSTITLNRIRPKVENYLSHSQSGFRRDRSTSDVVWTHRWLAAKVRAENVEIKITGVDMSAAFDTINRQKLLNILKDIIDEDELRLIRFLLSNTKINTRITGATIDLPFTSNIGTPQGDSLSPVLFIIYLEHALKEVRTIIPPPRSKYEEQLPREIIYADDLDLIGLDHVDINDLQNILKKYNLQVNTNKTEFTTLSRQADQWRTTKKVGSLIGDGEDIERRKHLSTVALHKLNNVWIRNDKIRRSTKVKLYRALVKSILTYNCETWAMTKSEENRIDTFHRKQLRLILNIRYPTKITNESLYKKCQEKPLSLQITERRWRLFGHILRRDREIPANKAMTAYFISSGQRFKGRPPTTLPIVINRDLVRSQRYNIKLKDISDLEQLRAIAQDRDQWKQLTEELVEAAKASQPDD